MLRVVFLMVSLSMVYCHKRYMDQIPNGHKVKNPCKSSEIWQAVGHNDILDGHTGYNLFGEDFKRHNKEWSRDLCMLDSDKDGNTNGEELGDPSCIWTSTGNHNPQAVTGHPGICEPVGSPACSFQAFSCSGGFAGSHKHKGRDY